MERLPLRGLLLHNRLLHKHNSDGAARTNEVSWCEGDELIYLLLFHANAIRQSSKMQPLDVSKNRLLLLLLMMLPYSPFPCAVLSTPLKLDTIFTH